MIFLNNMAGYYIKCCIAAEKEFSELTNQQIVDFLNSRVGIYRNEADFIARNVGCRCVLRKRGVDISEAALEGGYVQNRLFYNALSNKVVKDLGKDN